LECFACFALQFIHSFHLFSFNQLLKIDADLFSKEESVRADVLFEGQVIDQYTRTNHFSLSDVFAQYMVLKN